MDAHDDQGPNRKRDSRTESAKDDISRREQLDQGVKQTPQAESNTDLDGREHNPNAASDQAAPATSNQASPFNYHSEGRRKSRGKSRMKGGSTKKKLAIGLAAGGGITLFVGIIIIIFIIGLFKIPNLAEHIAEYQFARSTRLLNTTDTELETEALSYSVESDAEQTGLNAIFGNSSLWTKIKLLKTQNLIDELDGAGLIHVNYERRGVLGQQRIASEVIGDTEVDLSEIPATMFEKVLHPVATFTAGPKAAAEIIGAVNTLADDEGVGFMARSEVMNAARVAAGISLKAWTAGKLLALKKDSPKQADGEEETEAFDDIEGGAGAEAGEVAAINSTDATANAQVQSDANTPSTAQTLAQDGGADAAADTAVTQMAADLSPSLFKTIFGGPLQALIPLCIVYDGSIENPNTPSVIDQQDTEAEKTFYYVESAADQQKYGDTNAEAVGALDRKLGDITQSNPEIRASGGTANSSTTISPQQSPGGETTILSAFGINIPAVQEFLNLCPDLTSQWALGLSALAALGTLLLGPTAPTVEGVPDSVIGLVWGRIVQLFTGDELSEAAIASGNKFAEVFGLNKTGFAIAGVTVGLTEVARLITFVKANIIDNGLSEGPDFDNQADAGGDVVANQYNQEEFYGVPLDKTQVAESNLADNQYIADQNKNQSAYQRYLAFSNPNSLMTRFGLDLYSLANGPIISSLMTDISKVFNPVEILGNIIGSITGRSAIAASAADTSDYGVVQWGWTTQEQNLIENNPTYQPAENEQILNNPVNTANVANIVSTFSQCYTQSNGGPQPMGELLSGSNILITRDSNGNVTGGMCSEEYLGPYSQPYNGVNYGTDQYAEDCSDGTYNASQCPSDTVSGGAANYSNTNDLVFRWRLEQAYNNGIDLLNGIANPTGGSTLVPAS